MPRIGREDRRGGGRRRLDATGEEKGSDCEGRGRDRGSVPGPYLRGRYQRAQGVPPETPGLSPVRECHRDRARWAEEEILSAVWQVRFI